MPDEVLALIALTEIKIGGRKIQPGQPFTAPRKQALKYLGLGQARNAGARKKRRT